MTLPSAQFLSQKLNSPVPIFPAEPVPSPPPPSALSPPARAPRPTPGVGSCSGLLKVSLLQIDLQLKTPKHQGSGCLWEVAAAGIDQEGAWGTFWGDENDLHPDR